MNALKHTLKQYHKDQISLSNLKIKLQALSEKIRNLKEDKKSLEQRFDATLEKINGTKRNYEFVAKEVINVVNQPNATSEKRISALMGSLFEKENELALILVG